ncbi:MAG: PQQ-binding-like beta-propeller repeat protein [Kiritimatiellia bacterium]|jgi:outer membrane protein assembly factor BamB/ABC-type phosphate/phosphonate transport system substrate-binding protein|nr:PQQ-binding-like beta-propeller repeat protein [Kiritimatiellia bacterium]MDP6848661.1 PQQ-binding-like beta-propeller repeat protein [Kiritimatiellia bacterium]
MKRQTLCLVFLLMLSASSCVHKKSVTLPAERPAIRLVIMDPLALPLACSCVEGYAQRRYEVLAGFLGKELNTKVDLAFSESLRTPHQQFGGVDIVIGKDSVVRADAKSLAIDIRRIAMLSGKDGEVTLKGLFVVRGDSTIKSIEDLKGRSVIFGPSDSSEKNSAALVALDLYGIPRPQKLETRSACNIGAIAVSEKEADATVVSSCTLPLLAGCGAIEEGELKVIGETDAVPFIGVFVNGKIGKAAETEIRRAILKAGKRRRFRKALESRDGFIDLPEGGTPWTDWRSNGRRAFSPDVPMKLRAGPLRLWTRELEGVGMAGIAATRQHVVVADKNAAETEDIFRCLESETGQQLWDLRYPAAGKMDFSNSPRSTPVISDGQVYLQGALGHLHCVELATGKVTWKRNLAVDFGSRIPQWGFSPTPLLFDNMLIVNPGAKDASLAALDKKTGRTIWKSPGQAAAYASFIRGEFGGVKQIIGYDTISLGGWDPLTGERLWKLVPPNSGDFNVPTPIDLGGKLLVTTENNGTRIYGFTDSGRIIPKPEALNRDLAPDTATPLVSGNLLLGTSHGLACLDLEDNLETLWEYDKSPFDDYNVLIGGKDRVLAITHNGEAHLLHPSRKKLEIVSSVKLFDDLPEGDRETWSHAALVGNHLYVRNLVSVQCFLIY